jgi:multiple sugar transport system permease protein
MKKNWQAWLYLLPTILGLVFMIYGPVAAVFGFGFTEYDVLRPARWVGIDNYVSIFTNPLFWKVLLNTLYFALATGIIGILISLVLALLINMDLPLQGVFRTIIFIPMVVSMVSAAFIWRWMLNSHFGVFNYLLRLIGIAGPLWLDDPRWSMAGIILMTLWKIVGYNMIIFLAGLKNIPAEYYQAADIDGAGFGTRFFRITLPLLSPTTFFVIIVSLISSFLVFEQTYVMTSGGPANATLTFALYIFNNAFLYFKMGYASALAFIFFLIILAFTVMQISYQRKWVFYS